MGEIVTVRVTNSLEVRSQRGRGGSVIMRAWVLAMIVLVWVTLIPRAIPDPQSDRGIFVSVAERILAGDVLYQDVWDNKDPIFYFTIAITRAISPYADIALELGWIAAAALAVLSIARSRGCGRRSAWFAAFGMTPLILTGGFYWPGYTHLPGIALTLWVFAAAMSRKFILAGALVGILIFTKIIMVPMACLALLTVVVISGGWGALLRSAAGFGITSGVLLGLLQIRGELEPFAQSLLLNVSYSQNSLINGEWGSFIGHLLRVLNWRTAWVCVVICAVMAWMIWDHRRKGVTIWADERNLILWTGTALSLVGAVLILGVTGMWEHHAQVLYVAAILASVGAVHRYQSAFQFRSVAPIAALACLAVCLSGPLSPFTFANRVWNSPHALARLGSVSVSTEGLLAVASHGTYARVGQNDDAGHAYGLGHWKLACPRFHQYPFDSERSFRDVVDCLPSAQVIIVSPSAIPIKENEPWNAYIRSVETTLRADYSCTQEADQRICVRQSAVTE